MMCSRRWCTLLLFLSLALLQVNHTHALAADACDATTQSVYFGNGVWVVTDRDAKEDLETHLQSLLRDRMASNEYAATKFAVAYNRSTTKFGDVIESTRQILGNEYPTLLVARLLGISRLTRFFIPNSLEQRLNDALRNETARSFIQGQANAADVANHVAQYKADITECLRKVVVVAHSQGNLFVNLAFDDLTNTEQNSFAMVPVASPDTVAKRTLVGHVTFANDLVIDLVQVARLAAGLLPALLPNDFAEDPQTFWVHEFSPNYLTDVSAQEFIVSGVLTTLADLLTPTPPPPATQALQIVFVSDRDGNNEIYRMNADGSGQTRLTDHPAVDWEPSWAPDGNRIVFTSSRDGGLGNYEIYVMNANGSGVTRLTNSLGHDRFPSWSPDGSLIAFSSSRDGNDEIYVMNADGSNQVRLTNNPGYDYEPSWSPDGNRVAFTSNRDGNDEIYVMNVDGSGQTRITNNQAHDGHPTWSPEGGQIAFHSNRLINEKIYVMNVDGSGQTPLTVNPTSDAMPSWSPDGSQITFISFRDGNNEIYVMNADGSGQTRLTNNPASDVQPSWSSQSVPPSITYQPGNDVGVQDIWTTSTYSYTGGGGGPGGGLNNEQLRVGGWADWYYSLIQFDLTNLPPTAAKVELQLYMPQVTGYGTTGLYLDRITQFWDWRIQGTGSDYERLWWADRPAAMQWIPSALPAPTVGWYTIDITSLYNAWQSDTYPNYGVQLRPVNNSNTWAEFNSSNHPDASLRPRLVIIPTTTQCADGIDNDGDGLIDLADPGCSSAQDNTERSFSFGEF